ncbi:LysR family transcriptional regulator [Parasphingorhabdus sp.]|uniref:LysR family transcriptional regulator n=1 Tax=Parasphingorhabdus sp. TaxID=2709688 RepID=UPI0030B3EFB0
MNLRWITLFATVAEEGSFTRAATKLNIAQPWLSAQMKKLEYELGIDLLERENTGIKVTDAGKRLLPHAKQMTDSAHLFRETARSLGDDRSRALKLGSYTPIIDIPHLKAVTLQFTQRYKNFKLNTATEEPASLVKALDECRIDLAVLPAEAAKNGLYLHNFSIGKTAVYLLAPKKRKISGLKSFAGESVGIPSSKSMPQLHEKLHSIFTDLGIIASEIPEYDRRAIEHSVLKRGAMVAIALDDADVKSLDPDIQTLTIDGVFLEHVLSRIAGRDLSRAAERFWTLCESELVNAAA